MKKNHAFIMPLIILFAQIFSMETEPSNTFSYGAVIDAFVGKNNEYEIQDFMGPVRLIETESYRFFGIHEQEQSNVDFTKFRKRLSQLMHTPEKKGMQLIGDSGKFSETGTKKARTFLRSLFKESNFIEYGFTGYKNPEGHQLDINSFINEYVDEQPQTASNVLGNILGHTHTALTTWGTYGSPQVHNYVVVYNDYDMSQPPKYENGKKVSGFTTFGEDVYMSDHLIQRKFNDTFVCLEGGVQSFRQSVNGLLLETPITMVYNLRTSERERFFSATRFLKQIHDAFDGETPPTKETVQSLFNQYEQSLEAMWDIKKADYETKKSQWDEAWHTFVDQGVYKKIKSLCTFIDADELPLK